MKRKIAAILAADIAGYTKLVADDEEETVRRLGAYRAVFDDLIHRYGGRIFNTAGDAVMAEFPSSVEAVRCAVDVQESLRTRNLAYPASRQMHFRIGITVGDIIERDGDLLGDGVNIAARLEGLAPPGGLCISNSVFDQVANKVSVEFADIGAQSVKNLPRPVHAYVLAQDLQGHGVKRLELVPQAVVIATSPAWKWIALTSAALVLAAGGAWHLSASRSAPTPIAVQAASPAISPSPAGVAAPPAIATSPPSKVATEPPSPIATPALPIRPVIEGPFTGTLECDKLPWTKARLITAVSLSIRAGLVDFARDVLSVDGSRKVGVETGTGTLDSDGIVQLNTSWISSTARFDGSYVGRVTATGGTLTGKQVLLLDGNRHDRTCTITFNKAAVK